MTINLMKKLNKAGIITILLLISLVDAAHAVRIFCQSYEGTPPRCYNIPVDIRDNSPISPAKICEELGYKGDGRMCPP